MLKIMKKDGKPILATVVSNRVIKKRKSVKKVKYQTFNVEGNKTIIDTIIAKDYIEAAELFYDKWNIVPYLSGDEKINGKCNVCGKITGNFYDVILPDGKITCENCVDKEVDDSIKFIDGKVYCQKSNTFDEIIKEDLYIDGHHKSNEGEGHYYYDDEGFLCCGECDE